MDAVRYVDEELLYGARVQILLVEPRDEEALMLAAVEPRLGRGRGRGGGRGRGRSLVLAAIEPRLGRVRGRGRGWGEASRARGSTAIPARVVVGRVGRVAGVH